MNGYFGALMRSGGLLVAARSAPFTAVETGLVEVQVERSQPETSNVAVAPAATLRAAGAIDALAHAGSPTAPPATLLDGPAALGLPGLQERLDTPPPTGPIAVADPPAEPPRSPPATSTVERQGPPLGRALVRAALQWVADGPLQAPGVAPAALPPSPALEAVVLRGRADTREQALRAAEVEADEPEPVATPEPRAAPVQPGAREPAQAPSPVVGAARPGTTAPPEPRMPAVRDEIVEVSIGAIHVRVDAPAMHTADWPAPPPAMPRAAALAPRSALSRRALRRI